jgi:hypothetical protein
MSINVTVTSPDLDKQLHYLQQYPEFVKKHFRPAFKQGVRLIEEQIRPRVPVRTGMAAAELATRVSGTGINLTGRAGFLDPGDAWYIRLVDGGVSAHPMNTFVPELGRYVGTHPGFAARGFMAAAFAAAKPGVEALMETANDAVLQELKT